MFTTINTLCRIVIANDGYNAGLKSTQWYKEKCLPFVIQSKCCHCLIGKSCKDHIQSKYVKCIRCLHDDIRNSKSIDPANILGIFANRRRTAKSLLHNKKCRNDLSCDRCKCSSCDSKLCIPKSPKIKIGSNTIFVIAPAICAIIGVFISPFA